MYFVIYLGISFRLILTAQYLISVNLLVVQKRIFRAEIAEEQLRKLALKQQNASKMISETSVTLVCFIPVLSEIICTL